MILLTFSLNKNILGIGSYNTLMAQQNENYLAKVKAQQLKDFSIKGYHDQKINWLFFEFILKQILSLHHLYLIIKFISI